MSASREWAGTAVTLTAYSSRSVDWFCHFVMHYKFIKLLCYLFSYIIKFHNTHVHMCTHIQNRHTYVHTHRQHPGCPTSAHCTCNWLLHPVLLCACLQENVYQFVLKGRAWEAGMYATTVPDSASSLPVESLCPQEEAHGVYLHDIVRVCILYTCISAIQHMCTKHTIAIT